MIKQLASDVVGALKTEPLLLMILILNALGIAVVYFFIQHVMTVQSDRFDLIVKYCLEGKLP